MQEGSWVIPPACPRAQEAVLKSVRNKANRRLSQAHGGSSVGTRASSAHGRRIPGLAQETAVDEGWRQGTHGKQREQLRMQSIKMPRTPGRKCGSCAGSPETWRVQKATVHSWEGECVISAFALHRRKQGLADLKDSPLVGPGT